MMSDQKLTSSSYIDEKTIDILCLSNPFGMNLLHLVSRGHCIISELTKLSNHIPQLFELNNPKNIEKYQSLLINFSYFKNMDLFDEELNKNIKLQELDDELRQTYTPILNRIFITLEAVCKFISGIKQLILDLKNEIYSQLTLEIIVSNKDGKQLICEALFLAGFMLIYVDMKFNGEIRERLLVCYHRYCPTSSNSDSEREYVFQLFTSTGCIYGPKGSIIKRPTNYPEEYFQRALLPTDLIDTVVSCLRTDDIYNMTSIYSHPDDRTIAFSTQGSMLYIVLFFSPDILNNKNSFMTEIVNKFFLDSWIINIYMGVVVNLIHMWNPYKAARLALARVLTVEDVKSISDAKFKILHSIPNLNPTNLWEKYYCEEFFLSNYTSILKSIRCYNIVIKWILLHSYDSGCNIKLSSQLRNVCVLNPMNDVEVLLNGMFSTAKLEHIVKTTLSNLLNVRETLWNENKKITCQYLQDLSDLFTGATTLRIEKNTHLCSWFKDNKNRVEELDISEVSKSGSRLNGIINSLINVKEFHQIENISHVVQTLEVTRNHLVKMLKLLNLRDDCLLKLQIFSDFSYAWLLVSELLSTIHQKIENNPNFVVNIRFFIIKLSSGMDFPLMRLSQGDNPDFVYISQFYSNVLVDNVRKFLDTLPAAVFDIIKTLANYLTDIITEIPYRMDKNKIKDYQKNEERFLISQQAYKIAQYSDAILKMKSTFAGIIQLDPKLLLEEGINQELIIRVCTLFHETIIFNPKNKNSNRSLNLITLLNCLSQKMNAFFRTFEYVQDYIKINGFKMWIQSLYMIVEFNINKECNKSIQLKEVESYEDYSQHKYYIPSFPPSLESEPATFIGRLLNEIFAITSPKSTVYIYTNLKWFDMCTKKEVINGIHLIKLIKKCFGIYGLIGINKYLSLKTSKYLQKLYKIFSEFKKNPEVSVALEKLGKSMKNQTEYLNRNFAIIIKIIEKEIIKMNNTFSKIGQLQLIQKFISLELVTCGSFDTHILVSVVENLNKSLLHDFDNLNFSTYSNLKEYCDEKDSIFELTNNINAFGLSLPNLKKYCSFPKITILYPILYAYFYYLSDKYMYYKDDMIFTPINPAMKYDLYPLIMGIATFSYQNSFDANKKMSSLLLRHVYLRSLEESITTSNSQQSSQAFFFKNFALYLAHSSNTNLSEVADIVPPLYKTIFL